MGAVVPPFLTDPWFFLSVGAGLCLGSLATALVHRLPRGISMISAPRSACPKCGAFLSLPDLVPVFSWLFLRGCCRYCGVRYGVGYLAVEVTTLLLCLLFYAGFAPSPVIWALYGVAPVLVALAAIDLRWQILPDKLNLALAACAAVAGLLLSVDGGRGLPLIGLSLSGAALYGGAAFALRWLMHWRTRREPMGLGDVKFFAAAGLWLGPDPERLALFMLVSGILGIILGLAWRLVTRRQQFPFGPALIAAFLFLLLAGDALLLPVSGGLWENVLRLS